MPHEPERSHAVARLTEYLRYLATLKRDMAANPVAAKSWKKHAAARLTELMRLAAQSHGLESPV